MGPNTAPQPQAATPVTVGRAASPGCFGFRALAGSRPPCALLLFSSLCPLSERAPSPPLPRSGGVARDFELNLPSHRQQKLLRVPALWLPFFTGCNVAVPSGCNVAALSGCNVAVPSGCNVAVSHRRVHTIRHLLVQLVTMGSWCTLLDSDPYG